MEDFSDVIKQLFDSYMESIYTILPGIIQSYNYTKKKVSVLPIIKKQVNNELLSYPIIVNVPVIFPCTAKAIITFPLNRGDGCLILFSKECLENYLSSSGSRVVDPGDYRTFSLSDAICIPGLFPFGNPNKINDDNTNMLIEIDGANININGTNINLNGSGKSFVTYTELNASLQGLVTAINALFATKQNGAGAAGTLTIDLSTAQTTTIKTGG